MSAGMLMPTYVGLKRLQALGQAHRGLGSPEATLLSLTGHELGAAETAELRPLLERGWAEVVPATWSSRQLQQRFARSPLEHVERVSFEISTRCNLACRHCRNAGAAPATERDLPRLVEAARVFLSLGIRRFEFCGGEVTLYGDLWLDLVSEIRRLDAAEPWPEPLAVCVFTNGWWLEARDFEAAGRAYASESEYMTALRAAGVSHVLFSIDGDEARHDDWRGRPGLFRRLVAGMPRVAAAGLAPRVSLVVRRDDDARQWMAVAEAIYGTGANSLEQLAGDPFNQFSQFIDVGRGEQLRRGLFELVAVPAEALRCKAFFRPAPTLRVMANGEIGVCPLMLGQERFGNLHERPLVEILNHLDETPLYRLHATGEIGRYLPAIERSRFGERFDHLCAVRIAANRLALAEARDQPLG